MIHKDQIDPKNLEDGRSGFNRVVHSTNHEPDELQVPQVPPQEISSVESIEQEYAQAAPQVEQPIFYNSAAANRFSATPVDSSPVEKSLPESRHKKTGAWLWLVVLVSILLFFFTPTRITLLVLGIDRPPKGTWQGRSDTMILTTLPPIVPQVSLLSIPRDLWVSIPVYGENRINAAHYFAELEAEGTGMRAASQVVETNFGVNVNYVVRIKFDGFKDIVDAMGGVTVDLPTDMSGLTAGKHHLDGTEALKFVRDRAGSDDFFRQQRGQLFISAALKGMLNPAKWVRIPMIVKAVMESIDTNLPIWLWPRVGYGLIFSAVKGFDAHTFDREMVTSWTTDLGAMVLLPNWELINPMVDQIFH